jgi:hypothetical protein
MVKVKPVVQTGRYNLRHKHAKEDETKAIGEWSGRAYKVCVGICVASNASNKPHTGSRVASKVSNKSRTGSRMAFIQQITKKSRTGCHKRPLPQATSKPGNKKPRHVTSPPRSSTGQYKVTSKFRTTHVHWAVWYIWRTDKSW